jgi:predicted homoserine dehydrogenase-like protein
MNLYQQLLARHSTNNPLRVGVIGAGKFGSMFLAQARRTRGLHVIGVVDIEPPRARGNLLRTGWPADQLAAASLDDAIGLGSTWIGDDAGAMLKHPAIDVLVEATGNPAAGICHALEAVRQGKHIVMVNVEADALAGPLLARRARAAGSVYSLAYGDQPALIAEQVDWARACGFDVVAAGKGTKYLPSYHASTPDTVWEHYGLTAEQARLGGMNPQMFNSFLDGTKSAIEMTAVANATGLAPARDGLSFPPCGVDDLPSAMRPVSEGGVLEHKGQVEVVSSLNRDGSPIARDLRWGVYVVFEAPSDYVKRCFAEYGLLTDSSGRYAAQYKPFHLIGLELGISIACAGLRGEPTGCPAGFHADAVAVAKRALVRGEVLDGEGGFMVWGKLATAADSLSAGSLPIGLAHGVKLLRDVPAGSTICWDDVSIDDREVAVQTRRAMEAEFKTS